MSNMTTTFPDWFTVMIPNFQNHLGDLAGQPGIQALQIGAYTGDASEWLTTNILTGEGAKLTDVDTWAGSDEPVHLQLNWTSVWDHYRTRLQGKPVLPLRMTSDEYFHFFQPVEQFDLIYVDGDHTREQVARDADNAHIALKKDGILAFDDYGWYGHIQGENPRDAIDPFYHYHRDQYTVLSVGHQVWLQKTPPPEEPAEQT
jgi:Methyltransferase domain